MALAVIQEQNLTDIADAIRSKNGTSDTYLPSQMAQAITDIPTGGQDSGGKYLVQVIDYDGTVLKSDHLNSGATFTMPDQPSHSRLVFQEWSSPVTITNGEVTVGNSDITIGAVYTTASGLSEFDVELTKASGVSITFNMTGNKDWGDGTSDSATSHTYADYGEYTIKCDGTTIASYTQLFGQSQSAPNYTCIRVFLNGVSIIGSQSLMYCYLLRSVVIPISVTRIGEYAFYYCSYGLRHIILPTSVTRIDRSSFGNCYVLKNVAISRVVSTIESGTFIGCYSLSSLIVPSAYTTISAQIFSGCVGMLVYDFSSFSSTPSLSATSAFTGINPLCKIIVPDALYDTWVGTTNWATYASYIYKASEV